MIQDFISYVIASTFFSSLLVGAVCWLGRSWLSERLKNAIKAEYDQKLETHKAELKSQSDLTLERVRSDLSIAMIEHQVQFTRLHEKRAEVIAETYARLTELYSALGDYVKIFQPVGDKPMTEKRDRVYTSHENFIKYYRIKKIFIPENTVAKIDLINESSVSEFYSFLFEVDLVQEQGGVSGAKKWHEIFKRVKDEMPMALNELEKDFRTLLGDKGKQTGARQPFAELQAP